MSQNIVNLLGAGSGIDTRALVTSLVDVEREAPQERIDNKRELTESRISDYGLLSNALSTLRDAGESLGDADTFNRKSAAFPESNDLVPVSLEAEAEAGSYSFTISQLASAQSLASDFTFESPSDVVGNGVLTFNFGQWDAATPPADPTTFTRDEDATPVTVTIDSSNNTLAGVAKAINDADFGVQVSVVNDGTGNKLVFLAESGVKNQLQITASDTDGNNTDANGLSRLAFDAGAFNMTQNQIGQDSQFTVNGLAVTRESNRIDDVIPGFTYTLAGITAANESININIEEDTNQAQEVVRNFVEAYNTFLETIEPLVGFDEEEDEFGSLSKDALAKNMPAQIRALLTNDVQGLDSTFTALTNIGIRTDRDGSLSIDNDTFNDAFNDNFDLVKKLFTSNTDTSNDQISITKFGDNTQSGEYDVVITTTPKKGDLVGTAVGAGIIAGLAADVPTSATLSGAAATVQLSDFVASSGRFVGSSATIPLNLATQGVAAGSFDFSINVDGTAGAANISLPIADYGSFGDMATALQTAINNDANLSGISVSHANGQFTFTSGISGANSSVSLTAVGASANQLGISGGTATNGTGGANDFDFTIAVDGTTSGTISLTPGTFADFNDLATHIQTQINADVTLSGAGRAVTVTHDGSAFTVTSNSTGTASTLANATAVGPRAASLGITNGTVTAGATTGGNTDAYDFTITLDGTTSNTISLDSGTYADLNAVATEIQEQINKDEKLKATGATVAVTYDAGSNSFTVESQRFGASSSVSIANVGANAADLGLAGGTATAGVNVVGTINGVAGFGSGNILLPALGQPGESLSLLIGENATTAKVNLSRGFGSQLELLIDQFLSNTGAVESREASLREDIEDLDDDQRKLDDRMTAYQERLTDQFIAMERIIRSLQGSGNYITNILRSLEPRDDN